MRSRAPFSCCRLTAIFILFLGLSFIRETNGLTKNFVNSSHPDLRPTFVVNFDTSTVICQHSADPNDLHIHNMSSLCDGKQDCFANPAMHDEVFPYCEKKCDCSGNGACLYDGSNPQCYCDSGFSGKSCELADKNECLEHPCHLMAQCQNTLGSYECRCLPGYSGDGHQCIDIDECSEKTQRCPENSNCINLPGTFYCNCTQGFTPKGNQGAGLDKCVDINECDTGANNCQENEICENTIGSFKCVTKCSPGYKLINSTCFDIDECADEKLHRCDSRAECINTIGGYQCECDEGFVGDGKNCQPKASCSKNSAICDRHAYCMPKMELCVCTAGYTGDGITCHDINECEALENPCSSGGRCLNLDGGFVCCNGSQSDENCIQEQGAFCSGGCGLNAVCQNQTCQCVEGFKGDANKKCVDINECEEDEKKCGGVGDRCVNLFGGYVCCQHGSQAAECLTDQSFSSDSSTISSHGADFTTTGELIEGSGSIQTSSGGTIKILRGHIPKDFELASNGKLACTSYCPANSECLNGYCECSKGYGGNALIGCEDVDECITETCNISENEWCVNLIGSYICCNPTNATHDDCLGLEISKDRGLHVIGGNEEDTILATATNTTNDQLVTSEVVQQSRNFSSGQIIFTRGKVRNGQNITFGSGSGSGSGNGVWTEDEDSDSDSEEDDDLMEKGSGREVIIPDFTAAPGGDGNIRVRITTLGETIETSTQSVFLEAGKNSSTVVFETGSKGSKSSGSSGHFVSGKGSGPGNGSLDLTGLKPSGSSESESTGSSSGTPGSTSSGSSGTSGDSSSGTSGTSSSGSPGSSSSGSSGSIKSGSSGASSSGSSGSIKSGGSPGSEETSQEIGLEIKWVGNSSTTEPTPIDEKDLKRTKVPETSTTPEGVIDIEGSGLVFGREETIGNGKKTTVGIITGTPGETSASTIGLITGTPEATSAGPTEGSGETTLVPELTTTSEGSGESSTTSEPLTNESTTNAGESGTTLSETTVPNSEQSTTPQLTSSEATKAPEKTGESTAAPSEVTDSSTASPGPTSESSTAPSETTTASEGSGESSQAPEASTPSSGSTNALEQSTAAPEKLTTQVGSSTPSPSEATPSTLSETTEGSGELTTTTSGSTQSSSTTAGSSTSAPTASSTASGGSGESTQAPEASTTLGTSESTLSTEGSGEPQSTTSSSKETTSTLTETSETTLSPEGSGESLTTPSQSTAATTTSDEISETTITPEGSGTTSEEIKPLPTKGKTPASTLSTESPESSSTPEMGLEISGKTTPSLTTNGAEETTTESNGSGEEMGLEISGRTTPEMGLEISGKTTTPEGKITVDIEESTTPIPSESTVSLSSTISPVSSSTPVVETSTSNESSSEGTTQNGSILTTPSSSKATIGTSGKSSESTTVPTSVGTTETLSSVKPSEGTSAKPSEATTSSESPDGASTTAQGPTSSENVTPVTTSGGTTISGQPTSTKPEGSSEATSTSGTPDRASTTATGAASSESTTPPTSSESTTPSGSESSTTAVSTSPEATSPATSSEASASTANPSSEATTPSIGLSTPSVTPSTQAATIQSREEVTTPTKETFALPTTTASPSNETTQSPSENIKCTSSDQCGNDALCERRTGVCRCEPGFEGVPPKTNCIDVDECATGHHKCHESSRCQNYIGAYACFCPTGYRKSENGECIDINECVEHNSTCCGTNAKCVNKPGTYSCECESGFIGDGYKCVPNEKRICEKVEADRVNCANNRACMIDRNGIIDCSECISGYELINGECIDINECSKNPCAADANCSNLNGTFQCSCKQGYRGDGFMCSDINECQDNSHSCHPHADCTNLPGSFECKCQSGFEGDGITKCMNTLEKSCEDVEKFCGHSKHVSCLSVRIFNGSLSSICECEPGFRLVSGECVDIDECDENRHNCDPASSICVNTEGSFKCDCAEGYEGEGGVCTDIDECDRGMAGCDGMAMCINRMGSCGCKCMPGYTGDGVQCSKIEPSDNSKCTEEWERLCEIENKQCTVDEEEVPQCGACLIGHQPINGTCQSVAVSGLCKHNNDCNKHADCIDIQPNSHLCVCTPGFIGDGKMCDDIDECSLEGMCDSANSACVNTIGAFKCVCNEGFELDGHVCVPSIKNTTTTTVIPTESTHIDREPVSPESTTKVTTLSVNVTSLESSKPGKNDVTQSSVSTITTSSVAPKTESTVKPKPASTSSPSTKKTSEFSSSSTAKPAVTKQSVVESTTLGTTTSKKSETSTKKVEVTTQKSVSSKLSSTTKKLEVTTQKNVEPTTPNPTSKVDSTTTTTKKTTPTTPPTTSQSDLVLNVITTTSTVQPPLTVILSSTSRQQSSEPTPPPTTSTTTLIIPTTARRGPPSMTPPAEETTTANTNGGYGEAEVEETSTKTSTSTTTTVPTTVTTVITTTTIRSAPAEAVVSCSNCHELAICSNQTCVCREGFIGDGIANCSKLTTADCMSLPSLCASNGYCDTKTRDCKCDAGYIGDGYICAPHPQDCVLRPNLCPSEAICQNRRCQCLPGYTGDGIKCVSIHERASNCSQCDENASCVGGTTCKCNPGYFGNGLCCVPDPTDCVHFTGICHTNAQCDTSSRQCKCASGYSGNGLSCFPQKSCRTDRNVCSNNGICLPTGNCICRIGFEGDGYNCEKAGTLNNLRNDPISSCLTPCDSISEICIGGKCLCKDGFRQNSTNNSCVDINECEEKLDRCDRLATCQNTIGNHVCSCPNGYVGDGTTCIPHTQNTGGISVYCEADGMTLVLGDTENFEGRIFVRGQAENKYCSKSFSSLLNSQKPYVFKVLFEHCDVQLQDNHTMASTVVVQKHAMFLTSKADSYDLRCQYPIGSQAVESQVNVSELATTSTLVDNNSELAPTCKLGVTNEQQLSISSATVGDTLKLSLSVIPASANFGILPKNCFAVNIESGERYTLTDSLGCAIDETLFPQWSVVSNNSVQAIFRTFKWPDSSMIRFQCDCSPCIGSCSIPNCMQVQRFRRHIPVINDEVRENLVLMNGVEGLAVSSIINVHDSSNLLDDENTFTIPPPIPANSSFSPSDICVKLAPLIIAFCSFIFCSLVLLYLFSSKNVTKSEF